MRLLRARPANAGARPTGAGFGSRLAGAAGELAAVVAELDPECLAGSDAVSLYERLAGMERLVLAGKALLAPRIEASGVWKDTGHPNAAALLASLEGVSAGQARATLDIGRRLVELPGTEDALRRGALSAPKATELCGAGALDPDRESELLAGAEDEPLAAVKERCHRSRATSSSRDPEGHLAPDPGRTLLLLVDRRGGGPLLPGPGHRRPGGPDPRLPRPSGPLVPEGGPGPGGRPPSVRPGLPGRCLLRPHHPAGPRPRPGGGGVPRARVLRCSEHRHRHRHPAHGPGVLRLQPRGRPARPPARPPDPVEAGHRPIGSST